MSYIPRYREIKKTEECLLFSCSVTSQSIILEIFL
jgi:hypothetical protein